jgi:outer membrane protein OmpA-like peptidoglycan-associated protein
MKYLVGLLLATSISFAVLAQNYTVPEMPLAITAIERRVGLPQFLAEREGSLFSFAHLGDTLLENKTLRLKVNVPRGLRSSDFEGYVREQLSLTGYTINPFLFIQIVYFDYNSSLIRNDASAQLDKLALLMLTYPFATVEAIVHTDSRGSNDYNRKLAGKRGASIEQYLKEAGVDTSKLSVRVSGEEELVNDCLDKVNCDELLHQLNRRAEFLFNPLTK